MSPAKIPAAIVNDFSLKDSESYDGAEKVEDMSHTQPLIQSTICENCGHLAHGSSILQRVRNKRKLLIALFLLILGPWVALFFVATLYSTNHLWPAHTGPRNLIDQCKPALLNRTSRKF